MLSFIHVTSGVVKELLGGSERFPILFSYERSLCLYAGDDCLCARWKAMKQHIPGFISPGHTGATSGITVCEA